MTDFNTWNESLIDAVRKSSLFENEEAVQGLGLCARCLEIITELELVIPTLDEDEQRLVEKDIQAIKEGRHQDTSLNYSFKWAGTVKGSNWWMVQYKLLDDYYGNHNCIRDGRDED